MFIYIYICDIHIYIHMHTYTHVNMYTYTCTYVQVTLSVAVTDGLSIKKDQLALFYWDAFTGVCMNYYIPVTIFLLLLQ